MPPVLLIAGPHGAGKDTLIDMLIRSDLSVTRVRRHITRPPHGQEQADGRYVFVSRSEFDDHIARGLFAEYAHQHDSSAGTSWAEIDSVLPDRIAVVSINPDDCAILRNALEEAGRSSVACFVSPVARTEFLHSDTSYLAELELRMRERARPSDNIERRLADAVAFRHLELSRPSDYFVENLRAQQNEALQTLGRVARELLTPSFE